LMYIGGALLSNWTNRMSYIKKIGRGFRGKKQINTDHNTNRFNADFIHASMNNKNGYI